MSHSAGVVLYRRRQGVLEVLLVHPGGPVWRRRDAGAWSIPKGLIEPGEEAGAAARREFMEEVGPLPGLAAALRPLGAVRQAGGKRVEAFALEGDFDTGGIRGGGLFTLEWPPGSGQRHAYQEVDRAGWFTLPEARSKLLASQCPFLDRLEALLAG